MPLRARDRAIGLMTFVSVESGRAFGADDIALATQLGNTAALALDNANLYREAQRVNRVKDEFLATLSHELRTPLNAILGWARLLRMGKLDDAARGRALETIERNATAQAQLIEDLLDVSRIISGKFQVEVRLVDLHAVTEAALDAVRLAADAKNIDLVADLDPGAAARGRPHPPPAGGVEPALQRHQVHPQGRPGRRCASRRSTRTWRSRSPTTGRASRADFLPYVFDRFRQADGTTTRAHSGLGLGLAIVRHLVEVHGGSVRASSPGEGRGAVFSVRLPVAAVRPRGADEHRAEPRCLDARRRRRRCRSPGCAWWSSTTRPTRASWSPRSSRRAARAWSRWPRRPRPSCAVERHRPDVLVSDIGMPTEDGYSLMRRLRAMEKTVGRIPAAALTAYATVQDRTRALLAGYSSHLPKPIEPAELTAVVANLAGRPARG